MIELAIYSYLTTMLTIPVYSVVFPNDVVFPAVRLQRISGAPIYVLEGDSGEERVRFQVSCFAKTYREAKEAADGVKAALSGYRGPMGELSDVRALVTNESDLYESSIGLHHIALDVDLQADLT